MLTRVTLTGADGTTFPVNRLFRLTKEYPYVEWGILVGSREGGPRFPRHEWIAAIAQSMEAAKANLSLHLCGSPLREVMAKGDVAWSDALDRALSAFQRVQFNFHGSPIDKGAADNIAKAMASRFIGKEAIVQLDGVNNWVVERLVSQGVRRVSGLHDCSHGAGVLPKHWPAAMKHRPTGFAGGLSPDNLEEQMPLIEAAAGDRDYWIDMETGVRANGVFSLGRCELALEKCRPWLKKFD